MRGKNMRGNHNRTPQQKMKMWKKENSETTTSTTDELLKTDQVCQAGQGKRGAEARETRKSLSNLC